ncbi:MAG: hypothetical protein ACK5LV_00410 [Lachnospirales bacterium]
MRYQNKVNCSDFMPTQNSYTVKNNKVIGDNIYEDNQCKQCVYNNSKLCSSDFNNKYNNFTKNTQIS